MEKEEDEDAEGKGWGEKEESTDLFRGCVNGGGEESDGWGGVDGKKEKAKNQMKKNGR